MEKINQEFEMNPKRRNLPMIRAIIADPQAAEHLEVGQVDKPVPLASEALVQVKAISLNQGEVKTALQAQQPWRPGWDYTGIVVEPAQDGTGPQRGSRVVGLLNSGAWAEQIAAPTYTLAKIPDAVTFSQAATLPVAGLTALYALRKGGKLHSKKVLISGSTGGVGLFAHQMAKQEGAIVVGTARNEARARLVWEAGADEVILGSAGIESASQFGPYDLIIDTVGGDTLAALLPQLAPEGTCVSVGYSSSPHVTIDISRMIGTGGTTLYGFFLGEEMKRHSPSEDLAYLAQMIAEGRLTPRIEVETSWGEIGAVAQQLIDRKFTGKAVLLVD